MRDVPLNKEARLHRLLNQRRIVLALIARVQTILTPGSSFTAELRELFQSQGKFGSKDRRLYRELIYTYLRYRPWLEPLRSEERRFLDTLILLASPASEAASLYPTLPDSAPPRPEVEQRHRLIGREDHDLQELLPTWFQAHTGRQPSVESLLALVSRPPLWLRQQSEDWQSSLAALQRAEGPDHMTTRFHPQVPDCIQAPTDLPVSTLDCYLNGQVEIQDISSQILLHLLPEPPQGFWLDACAGAGGKTLQLARMLQPFGKVQAYDPRQSALRELNNRLARSKLRNVTLLTQPPHSERYDGVLVDAPCSGSGTWRRHPYLMRQTREQDVIEQSRRQLKILNLYASFVRKGGLLVYCTCSLSRYENEEVGESFIKAHPDYHREPLASRFGLVDQGQGITVFPEDFDGDGLHIAAFRRKA